MSEHLISQQLLSLPYYNVLAGSSIGYVKGVCFSKRTYRNLDTISDKPHRDKAINCLCWGKDNESSIFGGRINGDIFQYDLITEMLETVNLEQVSTDGLLKAIRFHENKFMAAFSQGIVKIFDLTDGDLSSQIFPSLTIDTLMNQNMNEHKNTNLECMDHNVSFSNTIATGGKENTLKVWDINASDSQTPIFTAKNLKNNWLNLRVPIWFTKMQFYPESNKIVTGTGYGDVRLYDPSSSQRRPVIEVKCGEHPLTGFCVRPNSDYQIFIGDTTGFLATVDLRKKAVVRTFKGLKGGITCIAAHPKFPIVTVSSVDKYVYCYDPNNSRSSMQSVYLKNGLNCLLCSSSWQREDKGQPKKRGISQLDSQSVDDSNDGDFTSSQMGTETADDEEDVWENMEVVGAKKRDQAGKLDGTQKKKRKQ